MSETIALPATPGPDATGSAAAHEPAPALLVLAPMLLEANAVRRGVTQQKTRVQRAGVGT